MDIKIRLEIDGEATGASWTLDKLTEESREGILNMVRQTMIRAAE